MTEPAIEIRDVAYRYGDRLAVDDLSLDVARGEIFALLGPNGSGKTTLFRLVSTLIPLQQGEVRILGRCLRRETVAVRRSLGVVFQAASLDKKLTVAENLRHRGWLHGLSGEALIRRRDELIEQFHLADRAADRVETLSGGMRRRLDIACGMLPRPSILVMDEPSTGLDPSARLDLWRLLRGLRDAEGVTIALTTHLLEEADKSDRLAILDGGRLVALDTPTALRESLGGDTITIQTADAKALAANIHERFDVTADGSDGSVRIRQADGHRLIGPLAEAFPEAIAAITFGKPTLEDVFVARTGHAFQQ